MTTEQEAIEALEFLESLVVSNETEKLKARVLELRFIRWFENESRQAALHRGLN